MSAAKKARVWQRMLSGRRLDLVDPSPVDVEIEDIAHGLARVARWNGQTSGPHAYSVAQHSVLVHDIALGQSPAMRSDHALMVLLHDAPEYVIGDMISPFKAVLGDSYRQIEARLLEAIHLRFGLPGITPQAIKRATKRADRIAAYFEATLLAGFDPSEATRLFGDPGQWQLDAGLLKPLDASAAQSMFLERFQQCEARRA